MRVVALEEHFLAPVGSAPVGSASFEGGMPPSVADMLAKLGDVGEGRIADMDAHGIDFQVLGHNIPGTQALTGQEAIDVARQINDYAAEAVHRSPDRLGAFAVLPSSEPDDAAKELARAKDELGFVGAMINGPTGGRFLDDPYFVPMLEAAQRMEMPIYLHPAIPPPAVMDAYYRGFSPQIELSLASGMWGWHSETAIHVMRLIMGGVFDRLPGLQLIIGHMGEGLPFMLGRMEDLSRTVPTGLDRSLTDYFKQNIHITTAGMFSFPPLLCSMLRLGADRIMFSVDYPFGTNEQGAAFLESMPIGPTEKELIAHGNAEALLGLASPA